MVRKCETRPVSASTPMAAMGTTLMLFITCVVAVIESLRCLDAGMERFYLELKCQPIKPEGSKCPSHYDCNNLLAMDLSKCHYKDSSYEPGDSISSGVVDNPCVPRCNCASSNNAGYNVSEFRCVHTDCPEFFSVLTLDPGCYHQYKADKCCTTGVHCGRDEPDLKCTYDGREYFKGQQLDLPRSACKSCFCDDGFDGTLEGPWCRKFSCDVLLHESIKTLTTCAPVFYGNDSCCPIDWRCPSKKDRIIRKKKSKRTNQERCTFGSLRLNKGDSLSPSQRCVKCICDTPPFITCIQTLHSECTARENS